MGKNLSINACSQFTIVAMDSELVLTLSAIVTGVLAPFWELVSWDLREVRIGTGVMVQATPDIF